MLCCVDGLIFGFFVDVGITWVLLVCLVVVGCLVVLCLGGCFVWVC